MPQSLCLPQPGCIAVTQRDNGSVFNHHAVNEVLARWGVSPLNSPAYYATYNGAIEQGIKELKKAMARALPVPEVGTWARSAHSWRWQPPSVITIPVAASAG